MIRPLTSLRLVFALMVFASHCNIVSSTFDIPLLTEGYVGVSFFFVLSGFIISYSYDSRFSAAEVGKPALAMARRKFWVARIARIYPLHWLMLFIAAAIGTYTLANGWGDWARHFVPNLLLCQGYIPDGEYYFSFNSPSWSLCCEQLFYILFPLIVPLLHRPHQLYSLFALCTVLVIGGMWFTPAEMMKNIWYVNPLARFPDFLLGMVVYVIFKSSDSAQWRKATDTAPVASSFRMATLKEVAAVALFIGFYLLSVHVPQVYRYSCYYWLPVALVIFTFARQGGILSRILSSRPLVWGGEISFGFYLIHHLLFRLFTEAERHLQFTLSPYIAILLLLAMTIIISGASYRWFEQPVGKWIKRLLV